MIRARTVDEYIGLIREALYEVDEMRASIEFDEDSMGPYAQFIDALEIPINEEKVNKFSEFTGLPVERRTITLDHLLELVKSL